MARIVLSGYMVRHPLAGNVAAYLQYAIGLRRLGHEVLYVEEKGWPYSCYDPETRGWGDEPTAGLQLVRALLRRLAPGVPAVFVDEEEGRIYGSTWPELREKLKASELLIDVGGVCWFEASQLAPRRVLIDIDPVFTQVDRFASKVLDRYHVHFSYGANVGRAGCSVPTMGHRWLPTVPPVVGDLWRAPAPVPSAPMTTVANWSAYGGVEFEGVRYGQKDTQFVALTDLPRRVGPELEIALSGADDDARQQLAAAGWSLREGAEVTRDLNAYAGYIAGSQAEFSVAKHAYVATRSGWFSDRTVCYLAAGRPAVLQETGFSDWLSAAEGVLPFGDADGAVAAIEACHRDLTRHSRGARELADRVFDASVVLPKLLDRALAPASALA